MIQASYRWMKRTWGRIAIKRTENEAAIIDTTTNCFYDIIKWHKGYKTVICETGSVSVLSLTISSQFSWIISQHWEAILT